MKKGNIAFVSLMIVGCRTPAPVDPSLPPVPKDSAAYLTPDRDKACTLKAGRNVHCRKYANGQVLCMCLTDEEADELLFQRTGQHLSDRLREAATPETSPEP